MIAMPVRNINSRTYSYQSALAASEKIDRPVGRYHRTRWAAEL